MTNAERQAARYTGYLRNKPYEDFLKGYHQAIEDVCEYLQNNIDEGLVIYHEQTWRKRDEFINKLKETMKE